MAQPYPTALVIASLDSVTSNNNVLYRLVRPLADGSGVQSTDRLVNVVPHRRSYCFERKEQVDSFRDEILRRPLVIQPVLHFGRGIGTSCGACYNDEPWVVMINQTHPKVLGRLQMGMDLARSAVAKGQSVEIKFRFGKLIERVYREHLRQKEAAEAESKQGLSGMVSRALLSCRYIEWEHGDLILRSHGLSAKLKAGTSLMMELDNLDKEWDFEDIGMHDMMWSQLHPEIKFPHPHLAAVSEDEIRNELPGWTVNEVSPLEAVGESAPAHNYSYAQANRLYASFRKSRQHKPGYQADKSQEDAEREHPYYTSNAPVAGSRNWSPQGAEALPSDWSSQGAEALPENWPARHMTNRERSNNFSNQGHFYDGVDLTDKLDDHYDYDQTLTSHARWRDQVDVPKTPSLSQADKYGHLIPQVHIQQPNSGPSSLYPLKKQDSDRSTRSTNADSGYCASTEDDYHGSRGGSYDLNDKTTESKHWETHDTHELPYSSRSQGDFYDSSSNYTQANAVSSSKYVNGPHTNGGLENPAFSMPDTTDPYTEKGHGSHYALREKVRERTSSHNCLGSVSSANHIAESFI